MDCMDLISSVKAHELASSVIGTYWLSWGAKKSFCASSALLVLALSIEELDLIECNFPFL